MKKLLLTLGTAATAVGPLATVVACGNNAGGDGTADGKLEIMVPWGGSSNQGRREAIEAVLNTYNKTMADTEDFMPISAQHVDSYSDVTANLSPKFQSGSKVGVPNLALTYPDTLGVLSRYERQLDLGTVDHADGGTDAYEDGYGVNRTNFAEFAGANDQIIGIEAGGYYSTSFGRSMDLQYQNLPVLKTLLDGFNNVSGTEVERIQGLTNADFTGEDLTEVAKTFVVETQDNAFTVTDDIFTDFEAMLDFGIAAAKAFDFTKGATQDTHIILIDSITNTMYQYAFALAGGDYSKFYFEKEGDSIKYHFNEDGHQAKTSFDTVYNKLKLAIEAGAVRTNYDGDSYASNDVKNHKAAFGIGSSSGFTYYTNADGTDDDTTLQSKDMAVKAAPTTFGASSDATLLQGASIVGIQNSDEEDTATRKFIQWFYDETKKVTVDHEGNDIPVADQTFPANLVANSANYVYASNDILNGTVPASYHAGQEEVFNTLTEIKNDNTYFGFENPVGTRTDEIRTEIGNIIDKQSENHLTGTALLDVDAIYGALRIPLGTGIIK